MKLIMENWRKSMSSEKITESRLEDWTKHSTLNLGQVLRHLKYFFDLPDMSPGKAAKERTKFIINDLLFAVLPPESHHNPEQIKELTSFTYPELLKMGYDPDYEPVRKETENDS